MLGWRGQGQRRGRRDEKGLHPLRSWDPRAGVAGQFPRRAAARVGNKLCPPSPAGSSLCSGCGLAAAGACSMPSVPGGCWEQQPHGQPKPGPPGTSQPEPRARLGRPGLRQRRSGPPWAGRESGQRQRPARSPAGTLPEQPGGVSPRPHLVAARVHCREPCWRGRECTEPRRCARLHRCCTRVVWCGAGTRAGTGTGRRVLAHSSLWVQGRN